MGILGILGLAESSYVAIGLFIFGGLIGLFFKNMNKVDRAETMKVVDKKIDKKISEELKPIKKMVEDSEKDIKEIRKDEIAPIKKDVIDLQRDKAVMNNTLEILIRTIDNNHTEIKELILQRDQSYKENFLLIFDKLERKVDKK